MSLESLYGTLAFVSPQQSLIVFEMVWEFHVGPGIGYLDYVQW